MILSFKRSRTAPVGKEIVMTKKQKAMLVRIIAAFIIYITLAVSDHMEILPGVVWAVGKMACTWFPMFL